MNAINNAPRPVLNTRPAVKPVANTPAPKAAPKGGSAGTIGSVAGAGWGGFAGFSAATILAAFALPRVAGLVVTAGITLAAAVVGGAGGKRIGEWLDKSNPFKAPTLSNYLGGAVGGFFSLAGGFWAGVTIANLAGVGLAIAIPTTIATVVLGTIGGAVLGGKLAGK